MTDSRESESRPWGYRIVVVAWMEGDLADDPEGAKARLRGMEAGIPDDAFFAHGHFERCESKPDLRETMGQ